ncbi:hypothetical protein DV736_g2526, partial [Chaetothyriales sp. CBS 134916]
MSELPYEAYRKYHNSSPSPPPSPTERLLATMAHQDTPLPLVFIAPFLEAAQPPRHDTEDRNINVDAGAKSLDLEGTQLSLKIASFQQQ